MALSTLSAHAAVFTWGSGNGNWSDLKWQPGNVTGPTTAGNSAVVANGQVTSDLKHILNNVGSIVITNGGTMVVSVQNDDQFSNLLFEGGTLDTANGPYQAYGASGLLAVAAAASTSSTIASSSGSFYNLGDPSSTFTVSNGAVLTVSASLRGATAVDYSQYLASSLIKSGSGTLVLSGANTYSGGTTVNAGTLQVVGNGGNCSIMGVLTVNSGASVVTTGDGTGLGTNSVQHVTTLNINGGTVSSSGSMYIWNQGGGVNLTGGTLQATTLQWGDTVVNTYASSAPSIIGGQINLRADDNSANASLLQLNVADGSAATDLLVSANLTESGLPVHATTGGHCGISKTGAGTLRITGSVQISGIISVEAGTLDFAPSVLNPNARIFLASSAKLLLSAAGTNAVKNLYLDGVKLSAGRWGTPGSVAAGKADYESPAINGTGVLLVTDNGLANRERWKRMKYGQFTHYVWEGNGNVTRLPNGANAPSIDYLADNFNATQYANDLQSMGVEYVIFTAFHQNFFPMFNCAAFDRFGYPGRHPQRDMIGDMITAVRAKGIRVLFYTHPNQPIIYDYTGHNNMINDVYGEVVDRYGEQIDGIYFDENDPSGNQNGTVDYPRLERTIHRRNPDLILIQNFYGNLYACDVPMGESGPSTTNFSKDVGWPGVSAFAMVMSASWSAQVATNTSAVTRSPQGIFRAAVVAAGSCTEGGGWAWAAGPFPGGIWEQGVLAAMQGAAQLMAPVAVAVTNTYPSTSWPSYSTGYSWGAATRSVDDAKEYVHVLWPPGGNTLTLPAAADGKVFANARLLVNSDAVTLAQSSRGLQLTLTGADTWNTNDTVITLDVVAKGDRGIYNNTSATLTYTGNSWSYQGNRNLGEYRNDVQVATANGDSFTFTFSGTDAAFISSRGAGRGGVALYLDGGLQTNLDLSSGTTNRDTVFSLSGLADATHTLTGVKTSGTYLYVDAFKASEVLNDSNPALVYGNLTRFNNTDSTSNAVGYITYIGSWSWQQRYGGEYNGDITYSQTVNDYFTVNFTGTGVRMLGDGLGTISFYLDGTFIKTVNMNAGGNFVGVVGFDTNGLAAGSHQLKGVVAGGPYVQVDEFDVYNSANGAWSYQANRNLGDYQNDIHTTANTYDQVNLNFSGTGIEVIIPTSGSGGTVQVALDAKVLENVNQYAGDLHAQTTNFSSYNVANLTPGNHQLRLLKPRNFGNLAVDAVRIYKGALDSAAPYQWGSSGGGGNGTWNANTTANWFDGANATVWSDTGGTDYAALFGGGAGTVTLASGINVNQLTFNTTGYTLQGNALNLNGTSPMINTASNVTTTLGSLINSPAGLTKTGAGALVLTAANTYTGNTTINSGTLAITSTGKLYGGGYTTSPILTVANGATLKVAGWFYDAAGDLGDLDFARDRLVVNGGTIEFVGNSNPTGGNAGRNFTIGTGGATLKCSAPAGQTWTIDIRADYGNLINSNGLTLDGAGNGLNGKVISGPGGLTKTGSGIWTLAGTNTYTGDTTVNAGTLIVNQASFATNSTLRVAVGALLNLTFTTTNTVAALVLGGTNQPAGIYKAATAPTFLSGAGSLRVAASVPTTATNLTWSLSGTNLTLSWPTNYTGWSLLTQTNHLTQGVSGNTNDWAVVPGSATTNQVVIPINSGTPAGFYRMRY